ncbi:MAG: hypothetical protein ACKVJE_17140 [Pseudomonadales bacterium]
MQLQKWKTVNRRFFETCAGPSLREWQQMIKDGVINGKILGAYTYVDVDQLSAQTVLRGAEDDIPDLLG